jgi:hypothetical protein
MNKTNINWKGRNNGNTSRSKLNIHADKHTKEDFEIEDDLLKP